MIVVIASQEAIISKEFKLSVKDLCGFFTRKRKNRILESFQVPKIVSR